MKITVRKGAQHSVDRNPPRKRAPRVSEPSGGAGAKVAIFCAVIVFLLVSVLIVSAAHKRKPRCVVQAPIQTQTAGKSTGSREREVTGMDELGGMTMAEWMKANNTENNEALRARKARVRSHESGR